MKQFLIIFILAIAVPLLWGVGILWVDSVVAQAPTPTLKGCYLPLPTLTDEEYIYAVLEDTNALLYCHVVRVPIDPIFQTATAAARITLTVTKTPVAATWTPAVPSQELTPIPTIATTPRPLTMTALTALNVRRCSAGQNPSTACAFVRIAGAGTTVQATGITFDAGSILWRKLSDGNWIAEIINGNRMLTP